MKLARTIHFDESDQNVFHRSADTGEWAISGGFEFSNWSDADLTGKSRQAFANGWLGLESFGRATFVAVTSIETAEMDQLVDILTRHFIDIYGAPSEETARSVALQELQHMSELCEDPAVNSLLAVHRDLTEAGVREQFRAIKSEEADLGQFAIHGSLEG